MGDCLTLSVENYTVDLIIDDECNSVTVELESVVSLDLAIDNIGMQGPPGQGGAPYIHTQSVPASIWTIVHNRGYLADVTLYDDMGEQIIGDIHHDSDSMATVTFSIPVSGQARVD